MDYKRIIAGLLAETVGPLTGDGLKGTGAVAAGAGTDTHRAVAAGAGTDTGTAGAVTGADSIYQYLEVPPLRAMGDFALPCFRLAKAFRRPPQQIAEAIAEEIRTKLSEPGYAKYISSCQAVTGYFNIFINRRTFIDLALSEITATGDAYGSSDIGRGRLVVVEFSSPNVAKPFHIGHLCSTAIGASIERMYRFLGYKTVAVNHIGDWGTQFGKLLCAYRRWGDADALEKDTMNELLRVYVRFHQEVKEAPELDDEARGYFLRLEKGEPGVVEQWQEFRDYSILEFEKIYKRLGVSFDAYDGESFFSDKMDEIVALLEGRGLLKVSEGARVVDLSEFGLSPCIIIKSDGATIYATRDLAAALYRKRTYDFYKNIYVVGQPQSLHFRQVFAVLGLMGYAWSEDCVHVGFGLVRFPDRKMATREGEIVELEGILDESVRRAAAMTNADREIDDPQEAAEAVGVGAILYTFLKNGRERDIIFIWDEMFDTEGDSGPYLQYTYARASSVLRRAGDVPENADYHFLTEDEEYELADMLNTFPDAIRDAADKFEPSILARHVMGIARAFNKFYNSHRINGAQPGVREARLHLCRAARTLLGTGLTLLGIKPLERM